MLHEHLSSSDNLSRSYGTQSVPWVNDFPTEASRVRTLFLRATSLRWRDALSDFRSQISVNNTSCSEINLKI